MVEIDAKAINLEELVEELSEEKQKELLTILSKNMDDFDWINYQQNIYGNFFYFVLKDIVQESKEELFIKIYLEDSLRDELTDLKGIIDKFTFYVNNKEKFNQMRLDYLHKHNLTSLHYDEHVSMLKELITKLAKN